MNNYDRALLFKLGYALTRRFAVVNHAFLQELPKYCKQYADKTLKNETVEKLIKRSEVRERTLKIDFEKIRSELVECSSEIPYDCIAPIDFVKEVKKHSKDKWVEEVYSIDIHGSKIRVDAILASLVEDVNEKLAGFKDCEVCPIQITPGVVADALKYIAVGVYAYKVGVEKIPCLAEGFVEDPSKRLLTYVLLLLDTAFST